MCGLITCFRYPVQYIIITYEGWLAGDKDVTLKNHFQTLGWKETST